MKKIALLFIYLFLHFCSAAQQDTTITSAIGINTTADDIMCSSYKNRMIIASNFESYQIDDYGNKSNHFYLYTSKEAKNKTNFSLPESIFNKMFPADIGTASYDPISKILWFSSAYNFDQQKGKSLKIYWTTKKNNKWEPPKAFEHNTASNNTAHPYITSTGNQLFFSSDRPGGSGGMDIWYCNKTENSWSEPIWAGYSVNTKGNEIFPTWKDGDLYYASDGKPDAKGLDIYVAYHTSSWEEGEKLPGKINSPEDDFYLLFTDDTQGYFSSNRTGGNGGDDIYHIQISKSDAIELDNYFLHLECLKTDVRNAEIVVTDKNDIVITNGITNEKGRIPANAMQANVPYNVYVNGINQTVLKKSILYLRNENGDLLASYKINDKGFFSFEYLPVDFLADIPVIDDSDHSVLAIKVSGQVYNKTPGDVGEGIPVYITSKEGELLALAYTSSNGQFTSNQLKPLLGYRFIVKESNEANKLNINDDQSVITIELNNNTGEYNRMLASESLQILDENNNPIIINKNEIFVIKEIYYKFDSDELNPIAKSQLRNLSLILENNPNIKIEIASHTDSRGTDEYNLNLSTKRANKVCEYLASIGIEKTRLSPRGYGEKSLKNNCNDTTECDEQLHAVNRRTEIKIFEK